MSKPLSAKAANLLVALILLLGFAARVPASLNGGVNTFSDDNGYLTSGVVFSQTGYVAYASPDVRTSSIGVGMPVLLGALFAVTGHDAAGLTAAHMAYACVGLMTALCCYLLGALLVGRRTGVLACALTALNPGMISANAVFMTETPFMCLLLYGIYLLLRSIGEKRTALWAWSVVLFCGAAAFKGLALLVPVCFLPLAIRSRVPLKQLLASIGAGVLAFALFFAPWFTRNSTLTGKFVLFTSNQGDAMLLGTYEGVGCPEGSYDEAVRALDYEAWAEGYQFDVARRFARRGELARERLTAWATSNPLGFVYTHLIYKPFTATIRQWLPAKALGIPERVTQAAWVMCLLLAAWGAIDRCVLRKDARWRALLLCVAVSTLCASVLAPLTRYTAAYVPIHLLFAATGAAGIVQRLRREPSQPERVRGVRP